MSGGRNVPWSSHKVDCFFLVQKTCGAPASMWLASCSSWCNKTNAVTSGWEDQASDALLTQMTARSIKRTTHEDPTQGERCINKEERNVWVNASSLALGVLLEKDGVMLEDACWLQPTNDDWHINLTDLDAVVKGINLALQWQGKRLHLCTDLLYVYHWVSSTLSGKARICTKTASKSSLRV